MELGEYKGRKGLVGGAAQKQIDAVFPVCPLCGSGRPAWGLKYAADLSDGRVKFRCSCCESALSITIADLSGFSQLAKSKNLFVWAYTGPLQAINVANKVLKGKRPSESYVRIEEIGNVKFCNYQIGEEVPVKNITTMR